MLKTQEEQEGVRMDEAWMKFMETGRVSAYLQYKHADTEHESADAVRMGSKDVINPREEKADGTEYCSDRNGLTGYADWRV